MKKIYEMKGAGRSIRGIAEDLGVARSTVRRCLKSPEAMRPKPRARRPSKQDSYTEYVNGQRKCPGSQSAWVVHLNAGFYITTRLERLGLAVRFRFGGRLRLALTRQGLAYLARRDRTSVAEAVQRWDVESADGEPPATWRQVPVTRSRPLARTIEHTDAVHRFLARISQQAREQGYRVVQLDPPHRATRRFRHRGRLRSIHPDAFGILRRGSETLPFFLEWERRAVRPGTMAARLAPYLRYYSSKQPLDDHGEWPLVLIVFDDELAESNFHGVARREMDRAGVDVPLWVSHADILEKVGPLGKAWRDPDVLDLNYASN